MHQWSPLLCLCFSPSFASKSSAPRNIAVATSVKTDGIYDRIGSFQFLMPPKSKNTNLETKVVEWVLEATKVVIVIKF